MGEGPGRDEAEEGRPFVGMTGQRLDQALLVAGLPRHRLYVVNATCCQPPKNKAEQQMQKAVLCCRPAFLAQIVGLREDIPTFAMGAWAAYALTLKRKGVLKARGFIRQDFRLPRNYEAPHGSGKEAGTGEEPPSRSRLRAGKTKVR